MGRIGRGLLLLRRASSGDGGTPNPEDDAPKTVALPRPTIGVGHTFVLAGFLKILTMASLTASAPQGAVRSVLGQYSQFLLVPGGLFLAWLAKQIVDRELQESPRFLAFLGGAMLFAYFLLYKLLYRYDPNVSEYVNRPRPNVSGPMAEVRARAGDRDRTGRVLSDSRSYDAVRPGSREYSDLAYYEGRYPSQLKQQEGAGREGEGGSATYLEKARAAATAAEEKGGPVSADLNVRDPMRKVERLSARSGSGAGSRDFMAPR